MKPKEMHQEPNQELSQPAPSIQNYRLDDHVGPRIVTKLAALISKTPKPSKQREQTIPINITDRRKHWGAYLSANASPKAKKLS